MLKLKDSYNTSIQNSPSLKQKTKKKGMKLNMFRQFIYKLNVILKNINQKNLNTLTGRKVSGTKEVC